MARIERLAWSDIEIARVILPGGVLRITQGVGSGLARRPGDEAGRLWALGDRGPNLKVAPAVEQYGLRHLAHLSGLEGAKVLPRPDIGPAISELSIEGDRVRLVGALPLRTASGQRFTGLPLPGGDAARMEPAFDIDGRPLGADPCGADTEALVALADGTFWAAEEYGPSLLRIDARGVVLARWVAAGQEATLAGAEHPVLGVLPAIAAHRRLNRGFEALAASPDERWLYVALQSGLDLADDEGATSRFARIWKLDAATGALAGQFLYPFDAPESFQRDAEVGKVRRRDLKICEAACIGPDRLLVLERISETAKVYVAELGSSLPPEHLDPDHRPSIEAMRPGDLAAAGIAPATKFLVFTTDDAPDVAPDLEGMAVLSAGELLMATDNDFGVEGVATAFYRVRLDRDLPFG